MTNPAFPLFGRGLGSVLPRHVVKAARRKTIKPCVTAVRAVIVVRGLTAVGAVRAVTAVRDLTVLRAVTAVRALTAVRGLRSVREVKIELLLPPNRLTAKSYSEIKLFINGF